MAGPRVNNAELELRVAAVRVMILEGASTAEILRNASRTWKITTRQAETYLARARDLIRFANVEATPELIAEHLEARRHLRQQAMKKNERRIVLETLKDEAKLLGLYAPEKLDVTNREDTSARNRLEQRLAALLNARESPRVPN